MKKITKTPTATGTWSAFRRQLNSQPKKQKILSSAKEQQVPCRGRTNSSLNIPLKRPDKPELLVQKRPLLLLEILIGLALLSMLISFLFTAMSKSALFETKIQSARKTLLERQHLQSRLQDIFISIPRDLSPPLYTQRFPKEKRDSLVLSFDNGIDPDPSFSGVVPGRIFLDENKNLCLAVWPDEKPKTPRPWRQEVLLSQVDDFQFEFLGKTDKLSDKTLFAWTCFWPKTKEEIPSILKLTASQNNIRFSFAFFMPTEEPISYRVSP